MRRLLAEVRAAGGGTRVDDIAERLGITRDEADAMIDYWVRRGALSVQEIGGCPPAGCGGCRLGVGDRPGCGSARPGPVLIALTAPPR